MSAMQSFVHAECERKQSSCLQSGMQLVRRRVGSGRRNNFFWQKCFRVGLGSAVHGKSHTSREQNLNSQKLLNTSVSMLCMLAQKVKQYFFYVFGPLRTNWTPSLIKRSDATKLRSWKVLLSQLFTAFLGCGRGFVAEQLQWVCTENLERFCVGTLI
jgi:hypothetical protein